MAPVCLPVLDPSNNWRYCPSYEAAILFSVLFGITSTVHIFQAWHYRKTFCWVLIMGAAWEFIAAVTRVLSIQDPTNHSIFQTSFVFLVLAPLWINAFDYMVLGRMIYVYLPDKQLARIKGTRLAVYFVLLDVTSFIIQLGGALLTLSKDPATTATGLHVYTAGVCVQQCVLLVFAVLSVLFFRRLIHLPGATNIIGAKKLIYILYASLLLITWRICFRIVEFSAGARTPLNNQIETNEWYVYVFDTAPMFLALLVFNIYHPGKVLVGPESEYPKLSKEEKRRAKEEKKEARGRA